MKTVLIGMFSFVLTQSALVFAEETPVAFRASRTHIVLPVGRKFSIDAHRWLQIPATPCLFYLQNTSPNWLSLSYGTGALSGEAPSRPTEIHLTLFVRADRGNWQPTDLTLSFVPSAALDDEVLDLGPQHEGEYFEADLYAFLQLPPSTKILIKGTTNRWATLSEQGILSGIPKRSDVGTYTVEIFTAVEIVTTVPPTYSSSLGVVGTVKSFNPRPAWISSSLVTQDARVYQPIGIDLNAAVVRGTERHFNFKIISAPLWIVLGANGILNGVPSPRDLGPVEIKILWEAEVDGEPQSNQTTLRFQVTW